MEKGTPIFNVVPFFEQWLHPTETPDQMKATTATAEPAKIVTPKVLSLTPQPLIKVYPTGSPQDNTVGLENFHQGA